MRCPFCQSLNTRVVDSRLINKAETVRRRRVCADCESRYTTLENIVFDLPRVTKSTGVRMPFDEQRLRTGICRALEKRPVSDAAIDELLHSIKRKAQGARELTSRQIGEWVMAALRELDQVAYVRFASVYRSFEDVEAFRQEIQALKADSLPSS